MAAGEVAAEQAAHHRWGEEGAQISKHHHELRLEIHQDHHKAEGIETEQQTTNVLEPDNQSMTQGMKAQRRCQKVHIGTNAETS